MTKVLSTRLTETEHKKFLEKCNKNGCNSADMLRDLTLNFLNGNKANDDIVAVLKVDPEDKDNIIIQSPRFVELNDASLMGLIATKEKPTESFVYLPYMDDEHQEGLYVRQWSQYDVTGEISIRDVKSKEELAGVGF